MPKASDLLSRLDFELFAIEQFEYGLFNQSDVDSGGVTMALSRRANEDIQWSITHDLVAKDVLVGSSPNNQMIAAMRPMCFALAFKILDMIVEWILEDMGYTHKRFSEKTAKIKHLNDSGSLRLPGTLLVDRNTRAALFDLYERLSEIRHVIIHRKGIRVDNLGDLQVTDRAGTVVLISREVQKSFASLMKILGSTLAGLRPTTPYSWDLCANHLGTLLAFHNNGKFKPKNVRFGHLRIKVPVWFEAADPDRAYFRMEFPVDKLKAGLSTQPDTVIHFDTTIDVETNTGTATWFFSDQQTPEGIITWERLTTELLRFRVM